MPATPPKAELDFRAFIGFHSIVLWRVVGSSRAEIVAVKAAGADCIQFPHNGLTTQGLREKVHPTKSMKVIEGFVEAVALACDSSNLFLTKRPPSLNTRQSDNLNAG